MGEKAKEVLKLQFDKRLRLEFHPEYSRSLPQEAVPSKCRPWCIRRNSRHVPSFSFFLTIAFHYIIYIITINTQGSNDIRITDFYFTSFDSHHSQC